MNRLTLLLAAASATGATAQYAAVPPRHASSLASRDALDTGLAVRGTGEAPDGYTPTEADCPSKRPTVRNGKHLSQREKDWVVTRRNETIEPIRELLGRLAIPGFDSKTYLSDAEHDATAVPNIGLAFSGGGYRAMLSGAGALAAFDSRSDGSDSEGNLGGLLQSATYISGLSGGGWLVGSIYLNNFTTVEESMSSGSVWQLENSILEGPEQYALLDYYDNIIGSVDDKDDAGYERSVTDYWGRMLSYQLINATDGGPGYTFSSIADDEGFKSGQAPLPFLIAIGRRPDEKVVSINSTVYEFTPWELGSSDPTLRGYIPLEWAGSNFTHGEIPKDGQCVRGFDNAGFVMGTSSSLFNAIVLYLDDPGSDYVPDGVPDFAVSALTSILNSVGDDDNDIADWTPNPFKGWNPDENYVADSDRLTLIDGGEDLQNVPYHPHILIEREVDVVFSMDNSADTDTAWPDGASAIATYERSLTNISEGTAFPVVPGKDTFANLGLNTRPVFFGCDAKNISDPSPLIVYIPNYPYVYSSNTTTFQASYNESERDAMVQNGWAVATQLNGTRDEKWPVCVGCAMLSRSFDRTNTTVPQACKDCFDRYCWNGTLDESESGSYDPKMFSEPLDVQSAGSKIVGSALSMAMACVAGLLVL